MRRKREGDGGDGVSSAERHSGIYARQGLFSALVLLISVSGFKHSLIYLYITSI